MVSGFKKENNKKLELAKDKKQLGILLVVGLLFLFSMINMFKQLNQGSSTTTSEITTDASGMSGVSGGTLSQDAQEIAKKVDDLKQDIKEAEDDSQMVSNLDVSSSRTLGSREKTVSIEIDSSTNQVNPFLPASADADVFANLNKPRYVKETITVMKTPPLPKLPKTKYPVMVEEPPIYGDAVDKTAADLLWTSVSGIMYDEYSPSAVVKIKGSDYLVKKGDIIKGLRILDIRKDSVKLQYGRNIYKGFVGQLLVKSDLDYTKNISNINSKFGGQDVSIRVRKY